MSIFTEILEYTYNDLRAKQRSIGKLFPAFGDRVKAVANNGGVSMREQMPDYWHFDVASGTKPGIKYDVYLQFLNLEEMIKKYSGDHRLWNKDQTDVDYRLLAAEILNNVDMRTSCSCPATLYWGQDYIRTQVDAQFGKQEERPPNERNPHQYGAYCKHGENVFRVLPAYTSTFASFLKKYWAGEVSDTVEIAKQEAGIIHGGAEELKRRAEERPVVYTRGGKATTIPKAARPGEEPEEGPFEEPAGTTYKEEPPEETGEEVPPENIGPGPGPATRPGTKKLGPAEPEVKPEDKNKKGKYRPHE
jgi:hypothetical protein